jgi:hypothetical protein
MTEEASTFEMLVNFYQTTSATTWKAAIFRYSTLQKMINSTVDRSTQEYRYYSACT